jgi:hypothetical protein
MQKDLSIPPVEALKRAFRSVKCLTQYDAVILANDAYGILVKHLSGEDAATLQGALQAEGVQTEIVDEGSLPILPATKFVHRLDCLPESLVIYDPLGRGFPLEWPHVMMVAAGRVRLEETSQSRPHQTVTRHDLFGAAQPQLLSELGREGEGNHHLVLEIILTRAVLCYSATADKFNFQYLGDRKAAAESANFALLVRDLATFAPHAILNRGAQSLIQDAKEVFDYPSRNAFHEEIIWLLWRLAQDGAA